MRGAQRSCACSRVSARTSRDTGKDSPRHSDNSRLKFTNLWLKRCLASDRTTFAGRPMGTKSMSREGSTWSIQASKASRTTCSGMAVTGAGSLIGASEGR